MIALSVCGLVSLLASAVCCQPIPANQSLPATGPGFSTSWDISRIISRHQPQGVQLNDPDVFDYLEHLASLLQITNCDNKYKALKLPSNTFSTSLQFPSKLETLTDIPNNTTSVEVVAKVSTRKPDKKLDWLQYLLNANSLIYVDHKYQKIVISFRSDLKLTDYITIYQDQAAVYWPFVYKEGFWKSVKKKLSPDLVQDLYSVYKNKYWSYYWSNYLKSNRVHSGYFNIANRMFEEIFVQYINTKQQYPDYKLVFLGHSMGGSIASIVSLNFHHLGIPNVLVTFNSPKLWSNSMADMYDKVSKTTQIRKVSMDLDTGYLRLWNTRDAWNLFPPGSLLGVIFAKAYKHSGLSLATEQKKLELSMEDLVVEYDLLGKWDYEMEHKHCKFIKTTDEFANVMSWDAHRVLLKDIWACVDLKP
ncbi:hypothetical protein OGAPHI_006174 [Ogataea philodendri]|uniref:triacylglycerol lipase n=1 Tax=Ogataea philodendri TaxID=1378263 RepID=A0A9P8NY09_9ASCO|nr:uncharacterized protein OGAPHI_006174 [Ogataea philodendri]KAH3661993.1 hypothetical protein OGAPHI_006174 [Ogataea philodendri]